MDGINAHMKASTSTVPSTNISERTDTSIDLTQHLKEGAVVSLDYHSEGTSSSTVHIQYPDECRENKEHGEKMDVGK